MVVHNAEVPVEQRIRYRVGINIGDVIVEEDDIFGDGVNIAARLSMGRAVGARQATVLRGLVLIPPLISRRPLAGAAVCGVSNAPGRRAYSRAVARTTRKPLEAIRGKDCPSRGWRSSGTDSPARVRWRRSARLSTCRQAADGLATWFGVVSAPRHESRGGPAAIAMARQLPMLCSCLPHGVGMVACGSSCSLVSSRSRWEPLRGLPWRGVMRGATSVDSAAVAASARAFREAESSRAAASLGGASVTTGSVAGTAADEASSRTSPPIPSTTRTTWMRGTFRATRTTRTRTAATATCPIPTRKPASGRTVCRTRSARVRRGDG